MSGRRVLLVGGLDPCGGAGISADARMAFAHGVHPLTVATCLTVQNRKGFSALHPTPAAILTGCLSAAHADGPIDAVKLGLCGTADHLARVLGFCAEYLPDVPLVVDPVLSATSGGMDTAGEADLLSGYRRGLPQISLLTPNLPELERLAEGAAAGSLLAGGCGAVLVKGGHGAGAVVEDRLFTADGEVVVRHPRREPGPVHGTGCALATAVAARMALGAALEAACRGAVGDLVESLRCTPRSVDGLAVPLEIRVARPSA